MARSKLMQRFFMFRIIMYASLAGMMATLVLLLLVKLEEQVTATGIVEPQDGVEIHGLEAGVISAICCEEGDVVRAGDVLIHLDDKQPRDELARRREALAEAEARLTVAEKKVAMTRKNALPEKLLATKEELRKCSMHVSGARKDMERAEKLYRAGLISQDEYESARGRYLSAEEDLKIAQRKNEIVQGGLEKTIIAAAEAELDLIRREIEATRADCERLQQSVNRLTIRAPINGEVVNVTKKEGESVAPGELLVTMVKDNGTTIKALVSESDVLKVDRGQTAHIYSSVYSYRKYGIGEGVVEGVAKYATEKNGKRFYEVTVAVKESPFPLRLGSSAVTKIVVARRGIIDIVLDRG